MEAYYLAVIAQKIHSIQKLGALCARFGSLRDVWLAPAGDLAPLLPQETFAKLDAWRRAQPHLPEKVADDCARLGIKLCAYNDDDYPPLLREIASPPAALFYRGALRSDALRVAMVGSRQGTLYGRNVAIALARELCSRDVTIVSGAARGIDTAAHIGALQATNGRTVAVLGCGVDVVYPPESRELLARILERGAVISEYLPGTRPSQWQFLPRNRIISGMSLGTVVVEAGERSGALNTASWALKQGREVFAVPGSVNAAQSVGTNRLIQQSGAKLIIDVQDIVDEIPALRRQQRPQLELDLGAESAVPPPASPPPHAALPAPPTPMPPAPTPIPSPLSASGEFDPGALQPEERAVYDVLERDRAIDVDEIIARLHERVSAADLSFTLISMELSGAVVRGDRGDYSRA